MNDKQTSIGELMDSFDGGALGERIAKALAETARGVVLSEKKAKGSVTVTFDVVQIGDTQQVHIDHTVAFKRPTPRGSCTETHKTGTPMYVTSRGVLTLLPPQPNGELPFSGAQAGAPPASTSRHQ